MGQKPLPGTTDERIPAIHTAATRYVELRDKRMSVGREEVAAKAALYLVMNDAELERYVHGDLLVQIEHKDSIKVTIGDKEEE